MVLAHDVPIFSSPKNIALNLNKIIQEKTLEKIYEILLESMQKN